MQPGETIQPTAAPTATPPVPSAPIQPAPPAPAPPPAPTVGNFDSQVPASADDNLPDIQPINWTASEFIAHSKGASWYLVLALVAAVVAAIIFLLTHDKITSGMVVIVAILFGIMGARQPRELNYQVDEQGVKVGDKFYDYSEFKSFSVLREEGVESIWFMPMRRFMPGLTIYFAPDDADKIADTLAEFLPFENRELDPIDKLMHRLRF